MFGHIIVDGPDAVGKTTLANYIKNKYDFNIIHSDATNDNDFNYHYELIHRPEHNFYDRFMAGEYVYPKIYNRKSKLNWSDFMDICNGIIDTNSLYIIINCSNKDILLDRLAKRGEFNYFKEMDEQVDLFRVFAHILEKPFFENYDNFKYVDISEPGGYDYLYKLVDDFIIKNSFEHQS